MNSATDITMIRDPRKIVNHPFLVADDGYWTCAADCRRYPANGVHRTTLDGKEYVLIDDAALSASPMTVDVSLVAACIIGDPLAAAVRAQAAPSAGAA